MSGLKHFAVMVGIVAGVAKAPRIAVREVDADVQFLRNCRHLAGRSARQECAKSGRYSVMTPFQLAREYHSNAKIFFQSFFMLMTTQPSLTASS
jgi:hypothetical protein